MGKKIKIKNLIALLTFIVFALIGVLIYLNDRGKKKLSEEDREIISNYYYDFEATKKNNIGILNEKNTEYILNATNEDFKNKILKLIRMYNDGTYDSFYLDNRTEIEDIYKNFHIKFFGDSNVEYLGFYDALNKDYFTFMTGKSIKKQKKLILESLDDDVENLVFFNGYNLEDFKNGEQFIDAYQDVTDTIKEKYPNIKIFICSLVPPALNIIIEDYKLVIPHNIYRGKEYDNAIENFNFNNAIYIDTKWIPKNSFHTDDGVHMIRDFYYVLIPYVAYFVNLYT